MNPNSDEIKNILNAAKTIAVVGLSDNPSRASFNVAKYLRQQRYVIFPVNPTLEYALDQKCYSDLDEIDEEIARLKLKSSGVFIDELLPEQQRYLVSWKDE